MSFGVSAAGGVGLGSGGEVDGFLGGHGELLERHRHLVGKAVLNLLGVVGVVEARVLCLHLVVRVAVVYHEVAVDEKSLELGEGVVGGPRLPIRRFVLKFASILLDGAEPFCH